MDGNGRRTDATSTTTITQLPTTSTINHIEQLLMQQLAAQQHVVDSLRDELRRTNETLRLLIQRSDARRTEEWDALASMESTLLATALAADFCDLSALISAQSTDDAEFSADPRYENCGKNITLKMAAAVAAEGAAEASSSAVSSSSSSSPLTTRKTYVAVGQECDIVCDEKAGYFSLRKVAPTVYADAPTKIHCGRRLKVAVAAAAVDEVREKRNSNSSSSGGNKDDAMQHHALWTVATKTDAETPLVEENTPRCYRRHCPKSQLDPGANFKCVTQTGPEDAQVVTEGESCTFLGCRF